jgi:hypothetical protein
VTADSGSRVDRLTGPDLSGFVPEKLGRPNDIGVIAILDGFCLLDGDGRIQVDAVRDRIADRLPLTPRLRQGLPTTPRNSSPSSGGP